MFSHTHTSTRMHTHMRAHTHAHMFTIIHTLWKGNRRPLSKAIVFVATRPWHSKWCHSGSTLSRNDEKSKCPNTDMLTKYKSQYTDINWWVNTDADRKEIMMPKNNNHYDDDYDKTQLKSRYLKYAVSSFHPLFQSTPNPNIHLLSVNRLPPNTVHQNNFTKDEQGELMVAMIETRINQFEGISRNTKWA